MLLNTTIISEELNIMYFWKIELIRKLKMLLIVGYHLQWRETSIII